MKKTVTITGVLLSTTGTLLLSVNLLAQPPLSGLPRPGQSATQAATLIKTAKAKNQRDLLFNGKQVSQRLTAQGEIITLAGDAWLSSEDTKLTTQLAALNRKTNIASSPGKLVLDTQDATINANTGTAYYATRDVLMRGQIVMNIRPRAQDKNAPEGSARQRFDSPAVVTCDKLDYNWGSRQGILTGNLIIKQKNRTVTADRVLVDAKNEILTLDGNVTYKTTDGDDGKAKQAIINYRDGAQMPFRAVGGVGGVFKIDEDAGTPAPAPQAPLPVVPPPIDDTTPVPAPPPTTGDGKP